MPSIMRMSLAAGIGSILGYSLGWAGVALAGLLIVYIHTIVEATRD